MSDVTSQKQLVSVEEVAKYFGLSANTIYRMVKTRKIPHIKIGSQYRFDLDQVSKEMSVANG